jgi:hypothetical protein
MSDTLSRHFVNCATPLRFRDGIELRVVTGVVCPQCATPIQVFDARRFDDGGMFIICKFGHDVLRLERGVP